MSFGKQITPVIEAEEAPPKPKVHEVTLPVKEMAAYRKPNGSISHPMYMVMALAEATADDGETFEILQSLGGMNLVFRREGWVDLTVDLRPAIDQVISFWKEQK